MSLEIQPDTDGFGTGVLNRVTRIMLIAGGAALITAWSFFGWRIAVGVAIGGTVAFLNFYWLKRIVAGMVQLTLASGRPTTGREVVRRFLLRYFLMALGAFAILIVSREVLYGYFAGLLLPVTAILFEAAYQTCRVIGKK